MGRRRAQTFQRPDRCRQRSDGDLKGGKKRRGREEQGGTGKRDTYDRFIEDALIAINEDVWSAFPGPESCENAHASSGLPVEVCRDPNHVIAEHWTWDTFVRQSQNDSTSRPDKAPIQCSNTAAKRQQWGRLVEAHFNAQHQYIDSDHDSHALGTVYQNGTLARMCHGGGSIYDVGVHAVTVRSDSFPELNVNGALVEGTTFDGTRYCVEYTLPNAQIVPTTADTGSVQLAFTTTDHLDALGIETGQLWYLGAHDDWGFTGVSEELPEYYYQSWAPMCTKHDAILDSAFYFYETIEDPFNSVPFTFFESVEDFVAGAVTMSRQMQDDWAAGPSGMCEAPP